MKRFLQPLTEPAWALLRIVAGLMFAIHGIQKLFGVWTPYKAAPWTQLWIGAILELTTGLAIALGAFAVPAAFVASGMMAVAYVQFHWKLAFDGGFLPPVNKGELALLYSLLFFFMACRGPGRFAVDRR